LILIYYFLFSFIFFMTKAVAQEEIAGVLAFLVSEAAAPVSWAIPPF